MEILRLKRKQYLVEVELKCPDGHSEWLSYRIPEQLDDFIKHHNTFNDLKGHSTKLKNSSADEMYLNLIKGNKYGNQ